jgi:hypothetical protein
MIALSARFFGIVLGLALLTCLAYAEAAPSDEQARALAIEIVAKANGISKTELTTKRMEGLEDNLFFSQEKILGRIRKGAYFYKVENGGWQITPNDVTYRAPSRSWYVAVSTTAGETFGLFGFKDANDAFSRLVGKIPVELKDAVEASIFAKFYVEAVYQARANVVYDELWLRHQAEDHFVGYADSQEPRAKKEARFRKWWSGFEAKKVGPLEPSAKAEGNDRYRVVMKVLEMTVGRPPELWEWSFEIQKNGAAGLASKRPVFPTSPRSSRYDVPVRRPGL